MGSTMVYLLHFSKRVCRRSPSRHYIGYAVNVEARLEAHRAGRGARITQVAVERGIKLRLARTWEGGRDVERALKLRKAAPRLCPVCERG